MEQELRKALFDRMMLNVERELGDNRNARKIYEELTIEEIDKITPIIDEALRRAAQEARSGGLRDLANAIKKVCPEVIPQIISAAHPEEEFIAALRDQG